MFIRAYTGTIVGIDAVEVSVEVSLAESSVMGLFLVGLPDNAVKESEHRIRSAFDNSKLKMSNRKIVVNLAPADIRKEGAAFDLPIAVAMLAAMGSVLPEKVERSYIMGELGLDGSIRSVKGVLPVAVKAQEMGMERVIVPTQNAMEAAVVGGIEVIGVENLAQLVEYLNGEVDIEPTCANFDDLDDLDENPYREDFADVKGQEDVKRAIEIAAAGGHNILMIGSPGSGKTMIARRIPSILPPLTLSEALQTTKIHSVAGKLGASSGLMHQRPFRTPHHLTSQVALIGGGQSPQPGEVSLANNGVLFLDELPEFGRNVLEVLRQPLEDKKITISRAKYSVDYPANFTLVAAMNPCPCGYYNHPTKECICGTGAVYRYMGRISGPLLDRIDIHIEVTPLSHKQLSANDTKEESSATIRERVMAARRIQAKRFENIEGVHTNAMMNSKMLRQFCRLDAKVSALLEQAMTRLQLSARAYDRIIKVARTIADIDGAEAITPAHIAEAINYRTLDRENWGR